MNAPLSINVPRPRLGQEKSQLIYERQFRREGENHESGFDGVDADPQGITNFNGLTAMGYTAGTATDNSGNPYDIGTDIRVYQGDYVGAVLGPIGFASKSAKAHGTFCEI